MHRAMQRLFRKQYSLLKQRYLAIFIAYRSIWLEATRDHGQSAKPGHKSPLAPDLLSLFFGLKSLDFFWPKCHLDPHRSQASQQEPRTDIPSIDTTIDRSSCTGDTQRQIGRAHV